MLSFENQMFLDLLHSDGLVVTAKGLGLESVLSNLIKVYCDPGNLVIVMNSDEQEERFCVEQVEKQLEKEQTTASSISAKCLPKRITAETSASDRQKVYLNGGVLFISTRILVMDLLTNKLPADLITGFVVLRAHRLSSSCQDAFVLRLYRQKNKKGFIKALSNAPKAFLKRDRVERVMRSLFLRNLYLWPRFHASITDCLNACAPDVVELHLPMTHDMLTVQSSLIDLLNLNVQELRRLNPTLEAHDDLVVENAMEQSFQKVLQAELDPIWNQLSIKTKQLVADMKILRQALVHLSQYDCVTFYAFIASLRSRERAVRSSWMIDDAADALYVAARKRVFGKESDNFNSGISKVSKKVLDAIEVNPKWSALTQILDEIRPSEAKSDALSSSDAHSTGSQPPTNCSSVLILTSDDRTARQVDDYLSMGAQKLLRKQFNRLLAERYGKIEIDETEDHDEDNKEKRENMAKKKASKVVQSNTLTQMYSNAKEDSEEGNRHQKHAVESTEDKRNTGDHNTETKGDHVTDGLVTTIESIQKSGFELFQLIHTLRPSVVVMYDIDMGCVRQIEVYQASNPSIKVKVFFLMFEKSVEEQVYLTTLKQEKKAFEMLIESKNEMVIPQEREAKDDQINPDIQRDAAVKASDAILEKLTHSNNSVSRKAQNNDTNKAQQVIVIDMREFRSELPSLLHNRNIDIEPVTLLVGDYILTPEICIERKSISDLIGSLQSGRLYNQAKAMIRHYSRPMLLIEFDQSKPFALQGRYYLSKDIASSDVTARLQLLTLHFPQLRILWSPSPMATAELFSELKEGREQPDPKEAALKAANEKNEEGNGNSNEGFNHAIHDLLSRLPGVTSKNIYAVLNRKKNLLELMECGKDELIDLLENTENGEKLYKALHSNLSEASKGVSSKSSKRRAAPPGGRFKSRRRQ